jgi:hypothetical protein
MREVNMQLTSIGELFISRTLQLKDKNLANVAVTIGKPQKFPDGEDYYCPYQIIGLGDGKVSWGGGIDEIQALLLTLEQIGIFLSDSEEYKQGNLSWLGSGDGNLGFPHLDSAGMLKNFI